MAKRCYEKCYLDDNVNCCCYKIIFLLIVGFNCRGFTAFKLVAFFKINENLIQYLVCAEMIPSDSNIVGIRDWNKNLVFPRSLISTGYGIGE